MRCPNCGHEQQEDVECFRCGIIFSKFQESRRPQSSFSHLTPRIIHYDLDRERNQIFLLIGLLALLGFWVLQAWTSRPITHPPGILIDSAPDQVMIQNPRAWHKEDRAIVPLALFHMRGRVLSTERYRFDPTSDLSPIDIALGWGPMSDQRILDRLDIAQGHRRFVMVAAKDPAPLPWPVLMANSSNMHMLPADRDIERRLKSLRCGQIIELTGYLVGVQERGQWVWVSSLSRTDTGDGACEIVWVERLSVE